jgi:TRAP-type transport system periplasmic protein
LMGASGEFVPTPDIYSNLEKGVIDGMVIPNDAVTAFKLYEVEKYNTMVDPGTGTGLIGINLNSWKKISPADQKIIEDLTPWVVQKLAKSVAESEALGEKQLLDAKVQVIKLPPEEVARWRQLSRPIWNEWIKEIEGKGLPGRKVVEDIKAIVGLK